MNLESFQALGRAFPFFQEVRTLLDGRSTVARVREKINLFSEAWHPLYDIHAHVLRTEDIYCPKVTKDGSQDGEFEIIEPLLPDRGTYLDIGASEPFECSNTIQFYRKAWHGTLVEPLPWRIPALNLMRPRDHVCPAAIMDYTGYVPLRVAGSCSSVDWNWKIEDRQTILVPCYTFSDFVKIHPQAMNVDYCSIDVEGSEERVLKGIDFTTFKPIVMTVEHVDYDAHAVGEDISSRWSKYVEPYYEEVTRTKFNIIYRRRK